MAQIQALLTTLKAELKAAGLTYADAARALELSEASVKRMFSEGHFTLVRLHTLLDLLGLDLGDLVELTQRRRQYTERLSLAQEQEIADDLVLLLVAVSVINGFSFDELISFYKLEAHELVQKLAALDRLKLIDLLPGNRIKLRVAPEFRWQPDGPIQRFFLERVQSDFFNSRFDSTDEKLLVLNGLLSDAGNRDLQAAMERMVDEFGLRFKQDKTLPLDAKHGNTLVLALRRWQFGGFEHLVRHTPKA